MFQSLSEKLENAFKKFKNKGKLTEADVKAGMREIKLALLEADVSFKVVKEFIKTVLKEYNNLNSDEFTHFGKIQEQEMVREAVVTAAISFIK